jgi:hypothetical protein
VVRQHQRRVHRAAHGQRLAQRVIDGVALVADVHRDQPGTVAQRLGHVDQLLRAGGARVGVVHAGGQADRTGVQRLLQRGAHARHLAGVGTAPQVGHGLLAQGGVADQHRGVDRRPGRLQIGHVGRHRRVARGRCT